MVTTELVDVKNKNQVNRFIQLHYTLYEGTPQWVPPIKDDVRLMMNREKHPFYEHSVADFFLATRNGNDVGRICVMENCLFNKAQNKQDAEFYLFDCINDQEVANALFEKAFEWARKRGLNRMVGPKGFSAFDGYGIQIEGFEHRQMMTMMNYNFPYYPNLVETLGFEKEVDFVSCYLAKDAFHLPERIVQIAKKVIERGSFKVVNFTKKSELKAWAQRIGEAYNNTFVNNWEYYPFTQREIKFILDNLLMVADPRLIKIITHGPEEQVVGFLLGFPDVSEPLQRAKGNVSLMNPIALVDILLEMKRTKWVSFNGAGVLPEFHGRGGNALLYYVMEKTIQDFHFEHAELTQVAETTKQMRADLINVGGQPYKNHRVYKREI